MTAHSNGSAQLNQDTGQDTDQSDSHDKESQNQKDNSKKNSVLWQVMAAVKPKIYLGMGLSALSGITSVGFFMSLVFVIQALSNGDSPWRWIVLSGVLVLITLLLRIGAFSTSHFAAFRLEVILRKHIAHVMTHMPLGDIISKGAGAVTKVMYEDVKSLHGFVADTTPMYGRAVAAPIVTVIAAFIIDWRLMLVALAVFVIGAVVMTHSMNGYVERQKQYLQENENVNNAVVEFVQAMPVIRTFDSGSGSFVRLQKTLESFHAFMTNWMRMVGKSALWSMLIFAPLPTITALTIAGVIFLNQGLGDIPSWAGLLILGAGLAESVLPLMWMNMFLRKAELSAERIEAMINAPTLKSVDEAEALVPQDASVSFRNVTFHYAESKQAALQNVSFTAPVGTVTALVGPSGAGKTTVARLIPRFWDVDAGEVLVGGANVATITAETLMQHVAFVFQDTFLFHDSIANNIALAKPNASRAEIEAAAKAAQAHDFIMALPDGYDTLATERGLSLSGGQRQRITIARAILQDCPILVLDEATAFADPESESAILAALTSLMHGKTVLMIAHRLPKVQHADQIVVFDEGAIVEQGKHDDLVEQNGLYAKLWSHYQNAKDWQLK